MNRQQATALIMYMQRANAIVPTTGAEWSVLQGALSSIEGVANGIVTMDAKPIEAAPVKKVSAGKAD